ncbi:flagellar hook-associated family protein [Allorhizobium terrae]|uniref:Flagellin n=1 Tax=Allorhizobium terrae TaxID=1848972 RepID=A0A4S3ZYA5_9HYPH|nr:flagellar hook-associated family protein [Allorhizobium terrae]THF50844.1 flagellar hook-associated family protein [Allorhizobium terrae]TWD55410.1 flagellar hook-associated protein 3 FlgL [Agrobacterium vitis]
MKTSSISSLTIQNAMRLTIADAQKQMSDAQKEVTTGKYADVGTALGATTSNAVDLTSDSLRLQSLISTNSIVNTRLDASQSALNQIATSAQNIQQTLVGLGNSYESITLSSAKKSVNDALDMFISAANTSVNGEYLFSGVNTDVKPMSDYNAVDSAGNPSAAKQAFRNAFFTTFGMNPEDPGVSSITPAAMNNFLTNTLEPMFTGAGWNTNWSAASDDTMTSRISKTETVQSSTSANTNGFRYLGLVAVVGSEILASNFSAETRTAMVNKAVEYSGKAVSGINEDRTKLGLSQQRVKEANTSLGVQKDIIETQLGKLTGVDVYEASTRLNNLKSLIETSYSLTSRLQKLSLVSYL